jgi:hypothetical protein
MKVCIMSVCFLTERDMTRTLDVAVSPKKLIAVTDFKRNMFDHITQLVTCKTSTRECIAVPY